MKQIYFAIGMAILFTVTAKAQPFFILKDIKVGLGDGVSPSGSTKFTKMNGGFYFAADDGINGVELWKTDGTDAGTTMVKDINPGAFGSNPVHFLAVGNTLYFQASVEGIGFELWKTDGTAAGTVIVKDLDGAGSGVPLWLTAIGTTVYFTAREAATGFELWKTDGTAAGTVMVKDINPGAGDSRISFVTKVGNRLYFSATDGVNGEELWKSNGTAAGTVMVKDINPGIGDGDIRDLVNVNGTLFFAASPPGELVTLMRSNGTEAGTVVVKSGLDLIDELVAMDNVVCFAAAGGELWKSNGTEAGTELIRDINPSPDAIKLILRITRADDRVFFSGQDGTNGYELWVSDGTCNGTHMVKDIFPGSGGSFPDQRQIFAVDNTVLFGADDGMLGRELWISDGTCDGTYMLQDLYPGPVGSDPQEIIKVGDKIYTYAEGISVGYEVWTGKIKKKSLWSKGTNTEFADAVNEGPIRAKLYPNPVALSATLSIYVTKQLKTSYSIIDQNGRSVQVKGITLNEGNNIISIETGSLSAGVYTIMLNNAGRMEQVRFIKQ